MSKIKTLITILVLFSSLIPSMLNGQELHQDLQGIWKAKVHEIKTEEIINIPGTETEVLVQTIEAEILEGERKSEIISLKNDYIPLEAGDKFFLNYLITIDGVEIFSVREIDRSFSLLWIFILFFISVVILSGRQGIRSLIGLLGTFLIIIYVLLPLLLKGYPPVLTSTIISVGILFLAIYFTHGFNRESTVAFLGTILAVSLTSILAFISVNMSQMTGFSSDESVFLNFATSGKLDFSGLLLGGIIIGVLGVLDDISITQAAIVSELYNSSPDIRKKEVFTRALRVGKEHSSALVNTLALAYAGASLPLLLLFSVYKSDIFMTISQEIVSTEIIRTLVGSIGLIMAIPITTLLGVFILENRRHKKPAINHHHH